MIWGTVVMGHFVNFVHFIGSFVHFEQIFNLTLEERVVSGSDSFSRTCAPSYRFCTELVHLFRGYRFSESFVHHMTNAV